MREIVLDVARRFDGKVYNKRFDNAALEELKKVNVLAGLRTEFRSPSKYNGHDYPAIEVALILRIDEWNYNNYESLYLHLVLVDRRINMSVTEKDTLSVKWLEKFNESTNEKKLVKRGVPPTISDDCARN